MATFLDLSLIIARLDAEVTDLESVKFAADIQTAMEETKGYRKQAFVMPAKDTPGKNVFNNAVSQDVVTQFGILFSIKSLADSRGKKSLDILTPLRSAVATALLNWQPGADYQVCEYVGGSLISLDDRQMYFIDQYRTIFELRAT